jgi:hypothetical protein
MMVTVGTLPGSPAEPGPVWAPAEKLAASETASAPSKTLTLITALHRDTHTSDKMTSKAI